MILFLGSQVKNPRLQATPASQTKKSDVRRQVKETQRAHAQVLSLLALLVQAYVYLRTCRRKMNIISPVQNPDYNSIKH
jgi:hypothetical protein